jgi:hypothetical protein
MVSHKCACAILLIIGMLLCAGCIRHETPPAKAPTPTPSTPPSASRSPAPTWRERFDAIPYGSTYPTVVRRVGEPTLIDGDENLALCVYYITDAEVYVLVFKSGMYTKGYVDTIKHWERLFARGSQRAT